jgi:hypothetical protein
MTNEMLTIVKWECGSQVQTTARIEAANTELHGDIIVGEKIQSLLEQFQSSKTIWRTSWNEQFDLINSSSLTRYSGGAPPNADIH